MLKKKSKSSWSDLKRRLTDLDPNSLLGLVQDLYSLSEDNQIFLHARFTPGTDVIKPYKDTISEWLWPDSCNQDFSVAKAKKGITDYKKAVGLPEGVVELMVYYCEQAAGFSNKFGLQHEGYFNALVRMFEQALKHIATLPSKARPAYWTRLDNVRRISHSFGYGVGDDMDIFLSEHGVDA